MKPAIVLATFAMLAVFPAWPQYICTNLTTQGTYSVTCTGFMSPAPGAPQVPATLIGTVTGTFTGLFTGAAKVSLGGAIADQTVSGTLVQNPDCTGFISYDQRINGQPAGKLNIIAHTLDYGGTIVGMSVDPGTNLLCSLRRLRYD